MYIYTSNEATNIDMFFDNLQVTHIRGRILEETHYYPFGLTMAGISSKALNNSPENKYKFNDGTELNTSLNVDLYETDFRLFDPQIGRFVQVDELADMFEDWSPFVYANNNPILLNDPTGLASEPPKETSTPDKPKEMEGVVVVGYRKQPTVSAGLTIINTPGTQFKPNPTYSPNARAPQNRPSYLTVQTKCNPGCTLHEHSDISTIIGQEIVTAPLPISKIKWLFRLRKAKQILGLSRLSLASRFGINSYKALRALKVADAQVHHLVEKRFANLMGQQSDDMLSIVVTKDEHLVFTRAWAEKIGYDGWKTTQFTTSTVPSADYVKDVARDIYKNYPEILNALGL